MIVAGSASPLLLSSAGGYNLTNSLRFRSSASAYLNRTPASAGNRKTWTWSGWVKRGAIADGVLFSTGTSGSSYMNLRLQDNGGVQEFSIVSENPSTEISLRTSQQFRDPSAWYHFVFALDTTQATSSNRAKLYVNGVQVTAFSSATYPSLNADLLINNNQAHNIGRRASASDIYFSGYLAEVNFIDGQALTPSSFGQTSATTGVWIPKKYTGTYGTNGFYLPFTDNSALTTSSNVGLGKDFSGNANYWTTNNISITSGSTYDSMTDVPTLTSATTANYCVLNPLSNSYTGTAIIGITDGNLNFSDSTSTSKTAISSMTSSSGKWYFEMTSSSTGTYAVGLMDKISNAGSFYRNNGTYSSSFGGGGTSGYSSWTTGDVIGVAWDADAGKLWFAKNNTWQSGSPSAGTSPTNTFTAGLSLFGDIYTDNSAGTKSGSFNFGQRPFAYTPPTGFNRLNTFNLPTPTIGATASTQANKYFDATTYTGTGSSLAVTNSGSMQPDFVWLKNRSSATYHWLTNAITGTSKQLTSNATDAESSYTQILTAFNSNGFTVGTDGDVNANGSSYVGWQWKANGSGSTNTAGSITSTVSANTSAGFSVATFSTPSGYSTGTVGHGLGVTPSMIIVKNRTAPSGAINWNTYHSSIGNTGALYLNSTSATVTSSSFWNNTSPTSTVFTVGSNLYASTDYVAYCFAQIAGYSAFGSYTGNGSDDGTFVFTGFRPRFLMVKRTDTTSDWVIIDSARNTYNAAGNFLYPNSSAAEDVTTRIDFVSNGFKLRTTAGPNNSGSTWIYMAVAESPFKYANAR